MKTKYTEEQKQTLRLVGILSVCLIALLALFAVFIIRMSGSMPASVNSPVGELNITVGMPLSEAKAQLEGLGINCEIIPTESRTANRVEKIEHDGRVVDGKTTLYINSTVKLYGNEVSADKVVYLTFDDGPKVNYTYSMEIYHTTGKLLDVLDEYGVKATFFIVGYQMVKSDRSEYVLDMMNRGHLIACHTSTHDLSEIYDSKAKFLEDVERFEGELSDIIGEEKFNSIGKFIRFPGGTSSNGYLSRTEAKEYVSAVREKGYKVYDWTALTGDAEGKTTAAQFISYMDKGIESAKANGEPIIVLMHDTEETTLALPEIIEHLIDEGYYFDTIDSCPEYTFAEQ